MNGFFQFDSAVWANVSNTCKHLICRLLTVDPSKRLSSAEAVQHPWFTGVDEHLVPPVVMPGVMGRKLFGEGGVQQSILPQGSADEKPSLTFTLDGSGRILAVSPAFCLYFGYVPSILCARLFRSYLLHLLVCGGGCCWCRVRDASSWFT